jgi:hydrogenase maturation protease
MKTVILGVGNVLMGDEGVGVLAARHLIEAGVPDGVDVVDGGTGGFHLMEYFQDYDRVVLVDATLDGQAPGSVSFIRPRFSSDYPPTLSAHDIGLKDLLDAVYLLGQSPEVILFAVSVAVVDGVTLEMTPAVADSVPRVSQQVLDYLATETSS